MRSSLRPSFRPEALRHGAGLEVVVLVGVAFAAHVLWSGIGFPGTDEGFVLAQSRRILEGEIPHLDFVTIRPAGSAFLHVPELFAGAHTFLAARLVFWLEIALIALGAVRLARHVGGAAPGPVERVAIAIAAGALTAHDFPPMAWHTVDGLALAVPGLALLSRGSGRARLVGFVLVGAAVICKQNFAVVAIAALFVDRPGDRVRALGATALVPTVYVAYVALGGGLGDLVEQLGAASDFRARAIEPMFASRELAIGAAVGLGLGLVRVWWLRAPTAAALAAWAAAGLLETPSDWGPRSFALVGAALGAAIGLGARPTTSTRLEARTAFLAAVVGWASMMSYGYSTPALGAAPALAIVVALGRARWRWLAATLALLFLALSLDAELMVRRTRTYHEAPPDALGYTLDEVHPGAAGIHTGRDMYELSRSITGAVERAGTAPYAIVPEVPSWWVAAPARNPLALDWHYFVELPTPSLRERAARWLDGLPCETVLLRVRYVGSREAEYPILRETAERWHVVDRVGRIDLMRRNACDTAE